MVPTRPKGLFFKGVERAEQKRVDSKLQCTKDLKTYVRRGFTTPPWRAVA